MLTAGFPCQPFSIAGLQKGFKDRDGNLFFEITRIIDAKRPKVVFLENVPNLMEHDDGKTFLVIFNGLAQFGYTVYYRVLASNDYGNLPQIRNDICDKKVTVKYGDSLKLLADKRCFKDGSVDLVITSPPYGDNATTITYGQFSVLPLKWIPLEDIDSKKISNSVIETLSKIDSDSLGGRNYTVQSIIDSELYSYSQPFSQLYNQLTDAMQIDKARKVASFFLDFEKIITSL